MARGLRLIPFLAILSTATFAAPQGFYAGVNVGDAVGPDNVEIAVSEFSGTPGGTITGQSSDIYSFETRGNFLYQALLGYNFTRYFGLEASYVSLGKQSFSSFAGGTTSKGSTLGGSLYSYHFGLSGVGYLPIKNMPMNLYGKLGLGMINTKVSINDSGSNIFTNPGNYNANANNPAVNFGVGALYHFTKHVAGKIEFSRLSNLNDNDISNISYNLYSVGAVYFFNAN